MNLRTTETIPKKLHLGDNVYVHLDEIRGIVLTTENEFGPTNTIVLEPEVIDALDSYIDRIRTKAPSKSTEK